MEKFGLLQYNQISFEKLVLKFQNIKTQRIYICNGKTLVKEDGSEVVGEFSNLDQRLIVGQWIAKKTRHEKEVNDLINKKKKNDK